MKTSYTLLITVLIWPFLGINNAMAEAAAPTEIEQHHTMTPQEYEAYRAQVHRQIEHANPSLQNDAENPQNEKSSALPSDDKAGSGYGQGYRARAERRDRAARMGGNRGGAMHRGGGRKR